MTQYYSQAEQDKFICNVLSNKRNGVFVEIGSFSPIHINNTYLLETQLDWTGLMFEINKSKWEEEYRKHRPNSKHIFGDALQHNYKELFQENNLPKVVDYLQLDIDPGVNTLKCLTILNEQVMDDHTFRVITFEHDHYVGHRTGCKARETSREIFKQRGYYRVFSDITNDNSPYEDWYVHPDYVDMDYIRKLQQVNEPNIRVRSADMSTIEWRDIIYPEH